MSQANKSQIDLLTNYMEAHPDLAKSFSAKGSNSRNTHRVLWDKLTAKLNANGPPSKSSAEWKRVWAVRKYNAKQKLIRNKKSISKTGGGPFDELPLDANEEAIIQACGMDAVVSGISGVSSFGCDEQEFEDQLNELTGDTLVVMSEVVEVPQSVVQKEATNVKPKKNKNQNENLLAKKQIELQEKFIEAQKENLDFVIKSLDNINESLKQQTFCLEKEMTNINTSLKEINNCMQSLCQINEKERICSNALKREELNLKRMELELAKAVNEIKISELTKK